MPSHASKSLSNKLYKLVKIFETQEENLDKYRNLVEDYIIKLDDLTDKLDSDSMLWRSKIDTAKECDKILRRVSFMIFSRIERDEEVIDELLEAIGLLEDL